MGSNPRKVCYEYAMSSQGIREPPYRYIYGILKEISNMINKSTSSPMDVSHYIFPRIQPHIHSWLHIYGKNIIYWQGTQAELVVSEPELLKEIMSVREISMGRPDGGPILNKLLGDGMLLSHGDKWVNNDLSMAKAMVESAKMIFQRWKDVGVKEEVCEEFRMLASEVIERTAFGNNYEDGKQVF
ncbi:hypothetical protein QVD17_32006 [Tagetes erecta]|uniref:Cytochrome P450 n=1 Tax=Tagetes erecta TaxID=13708 RepID=A0AAD8K8U7_TARER|nr:hypothetical protein QVD17_32006 [Tagetes erecta]